MIIRKHFRMTKITYYFLYVSPEKQRTQHNVNTVYTSNTANERVAQKWFCRFRELPHYHGKNASIEGCKHYVISSLSPNMEL